MQRRARVLVLVSLAACSDESPPLDPPTLAWSPCPTITGGTDTGADCGEAEVPIDWDDPDGPRLHLFVKRIGRIDAPTQIWMLNGGPGASGADFDPLAAELAGSGAFVFYLPDHRGTGRSSRLGCSAEDDASPGGFDIIDSEWDACVDELRVAHAAHLPGLTTTQAARDLAWLIEQTRSDGQAINVWGGSYGTRWAQRYLQIEPAQASSITLHGVVPADRTMTDYDAVYDETGRAFLARCGDDLFCGSRLGTGATRAQAIWDSLDAGQCAQAGLTKQMLRPFFAALLLWSWHERALIPATLYRLERCNPSDVTALRYLRAVLSQPPTPSVADRLQSRLLGLHVSASEFWPDTQPTLDELVAIDNRSIVSFGSAVRIRTRVDTWPSYERDAYANAYPDTELPVLIINGEFDPATTAAGAHEVATHYTRPGQTLVIGPDAAHSFTSPTTSGAWCFGLLLLAWAQSPGTPYSCIDDMVPMDFRGTDRVAAYFGMTDLWDGVMATARVVAPRSTELLRRMQRASW